MYDFVTQCTLQRGVATKTFEKSPFGIVCIEDYARNKFISSVETEVKSATDLHNLLRSRAADPYCYWMRAKKKTSEKWHRRLLNATVEDNVLVEPTYRKADHYWFCLDFDDIPDVDPAMFTNMGALRKHIWEACIEPLPAWLHRNCTVQLSSSTAIKRPGKLSAHLWFWGNRKVSGYSIARTLKKLGCDFVDTVTLRDVTPHYVSKPVCFGFRDPIQKRVFVLNPASDLEETSLVAFPDDIYDTETYHKVREREREEAAKEVRRRARKHSVSTGKGPSLYVRRAFEAGLSTIRDALERGFGSYDAVRKETLTLSRLVKSGECTEDYYFREFVDQVVRMNQGKHPAYKIERLAQGALEKT